MTTTNKLKDKVLVGRTMPRHIGIAYGRHIFRLAHGGRDCGLWLRDLPLNMADLASELGIHWPLKAYFAECKRAGITPMFDETYYARWNRAV